MSSSIPKSRTILATLRSGDLSGLTHFSDFWRKWKSQGDQIDVFDSREQIGVGHYKLWRLLLEERRQWRRLLKRNYGFNVCTGKFWRSKEYDVISQSIPVLEKYSPNNSIKTDAIVLDHWSRRRQCLRHPFYRALEQYLAVWDCLEQCGDPPEYLANPFFVAYSERQPFLMINGEQYLKRFLFDEMAQTHAIHGETTRQYLSKPDQRFRCRDIKAAFNAVYMPLIKILQPEAGPEGDTDDFYGAFADVGISLRKDIRLKKVVEDDGNNPYEYKRQLIPNVVTYEVLPNLWTIPDLVEREKAFHRLPGKTAYALGKMLGVVRRRKQPLTVEIREETSESSTAKHKTRPASEQTDEKKLQMASSMLDQLPQRQREVFMMSRGQNMTLKEIASELDIQPGTAASHLARAVFKIKKLRVEQNIS